MKQTVKTSRTAGYLEKIFGHLNRDWWNGELEEPIITIQSTPRAYGHVTVAKTWKRKDEDRHELNLGAVLSATRGERKRTMAKKTCLHYVGVTCIDGSCPVAVEHADGNYHFTLKCMDCFYNKQCEDCYFCKEDGTCELKEEDE